MLSWFTGSTLLGSAAITADPTVTTGGLVIAGLSFVGYFIRHQQGEIKRLTERLDEAKKQSEKREEEARLQSEKREAEIRDLRHQLADLQKKTKTTP